MGAFSRSSPLGAVQFQVTYWQRVQINHRLRTGSAFMYRLGSGSSFNCRLYIGSGFKTIIYIYKGYAPATCSPTTKCWHQVDPLQKMPMGAFSQSSPLAEALPEPLLHITNIKSKDFILHILFFQWMPFYKVCKKSRRVAGSFCKKSVNTFEEDYKNLGTSASFFYKTTLPGGL